MNAKVAIISLSGLLFACALQSPAAAQNPLPTAPAPAAGTAPEYQHHIVIIRAATCRAFLDLSEDDRASASMFYIGYTVSRRKRDKIDVADLSGLEAAALRYCAAYPDWPAAVAFNRAFADNGR